MLNPNIVSASKLFMKVFLLHMNNELLLMHIQSYQETQILPRSHISFIPFELLKLVCNSLKSLRLIN